MKIPHHVFHGLYVFDYIKQDVQSARESDKLIKKFAPWPIVSPLAVYAGKKDEESDMKDFASEEDARDYLYTDEEIYEYKEGSKTDKKLETCKNFIKIKQADLVKYRMFFHNMLKGASITHDFKYEIMGSVSKTVEKPCCEGVYGLSTTAKYDEETGGHQCDNAVWSFYYGSKSAGTVNLNNGSDGGSRSSGPFSISSSEAASLKVGRNVYLTFDPQVDSPHEGINACEIEKTGGPTEQTGFSSDPLQTAGNVSVEVCYELEGENKEPTFPEIACCCPPKRLLTDGPDPRKYKEENTNNYECSRQHSVQIEGNIKFDSTDIFKLKELEGRFPALEIERSIEKPDLNSEKKDSINDSYRNINTDEIYEKEWEFNEKNYRDVFSKNRKTFPYGFSILNDPIISPISINSEKNKIHISLKNRGFKFASDKTFKTQSELKSDKNFGSFLLKGSFERFSTPKAERTSSSDKEEYDPSIGAEYEINFKLKPLVFLKEAEEYLCFIDLNCVLNCDNGPLTWSSGDRYKSSDPKDEDYLKYDNYSLHIGEFDNQLFKDIKITSLRSQIGEFLDAEKYDKRIIERNGKLKKTEFKIEFSKEGSTVQPATFECFTYEKPEKSTLSFEKLYPKALTEDEFNQYSNDPSALGGPEPTKRNCLNGGLNVNWSFIKNLKFDLFSWNKDDFDDAATYPNKVN